MYDDKCLCSLIMLKRRYYCTICNSITSVL